MKIFKYTIPEEDYFSLKLPKGAKILTVQEQHGEAHIWAIVNPRAKKVTRHFHQAGTGNYLGKDFKKLHYIGTFQLHSGNYVGHLFEVKQ